MIWIAESGSAPDPFWSGSEQAAPQVIVRLHHAGSWPAMIGGVPVVPIYDITPPTIRDRAYEAAIDWLQRASTTRGANGVALREVVWHEDWRLWWTIDLLLHDFIWIWVRCIESVDCILQQYQPDRVSVWGHSDSFPWMRDAALAAVTRFSQGQCSAEYVPYGEDPQSTRPEIGGQIVMHGSWTPTVPLDDVFEVPAARGVRMDARSDGLRLVSLSTRAAFTRVLSEAPTVIDVRARHFSGSLEFALDTGRHRQTVSVSHGTVRMGRMRAKMGTGDFLRFTLEICNGWAFLYANNALLLEGRALRGRSPAVTWGHLSTEADSESQWLTVSWGARPADSVTAPQPVPWLRRVVRKLRRMQRPPRLFDRSRATDLAPLLTASEGRYNVKGAPAGDENTPPTIILSWGDEMRWHVENGVATVYDQFSDNYEAALRDAGERPHTVALKAISGMIPREVTQNIIPVDFRPWHPKRFADERLIDQLLGAWHAWRGTSAGSNGGPLARLPEYRGLSLDAFLNTELDMLLPHMVPKIAQAAGIAEVCARLRPRVAIFTHFATSQRHLIDVVRKKGVQVVAPIIGCDSHEHLFYGLRDASSGIPLADVYTVWGQAEKEALEARGDFPRPLIATGRARHDTFARRKIEPSVDGWLQSIGLGAHVRWVITFADVLKCTNKTPIVSRDNALALYRGMLRALGDRDDIAIVYKPWRGDDLQMVRALVAEIGDPRATVLHPDCVPFHNVDLLAHSLTIVSSPTSMLAEYATMGARPTVLILPDTTYFHGTVIENLFIPFGRIVRTVEEIEPAIREVLEGPVALNEAQRAALAHAFGPSDGQSGRRTVEAILATAPQPR